MRQLEPLPDVEVEPEKLTSQNQKIIEVIIGFLGWYLFTWLYASWLPVSGICSGPYGCAFEIWAYLPLIISIVSLLVCAVVKRLRSVALGILIAIALNLMISLLLGMFFNALCFIPFFIKP